MKSRLSLSTLPRFCYLYDGVLFLGVILLLNGFSIFWTTLHTLQTFPMGPDEYNYLTLANTFAHGMLYIPSPQPRFFFDTLNVINNGHYYDKAPPGWPMLLALGVPWKLIWLINPLLGLFTLVILFEFTKKFISLTVAILVLTLTLGCPYFIFNSSCYFPHPSCLLCVLLGAYFLLVSQPSWSSYLGYGIVCFPR